MFFTRSLYAIGMLLVGLSWLGNRTTGQEPAAASQPQVKQVRLLSIGNSFSRNATRFLEDLAHAGGHRLTHRAIIVGGATLELHAEQALAYERDAQDPKGWYSSGRSLQQELQAASWDFVTIQQASIKSHDISTYRPFASQLQNLISRYAPMAELLVHQTWAYRQDDSRFSAPSENPDQPSDQADMYNRLASAYQAIAAELGVRQISVGDAFFMADTDTKYGYRPDASFDWTAAKRPQLPDQTHSLHVGWRWQQQKQNEGAWSLQMDGHHASTAGEYLGACVWYEVLFQESCVGNSFIPPTVGAEYARFLQRTAHRAATSAALLSRTPKQTVAVDDLLPQRYVFQARASRLDARTKEYPGINFVFGSNEEPLDLEHASVDTRVAPQGKLVVWLMAHNDALFERLNGYGLHAIQVSYANKWFNLLCQPRPQNAQARGNVRLEAATGQDFSDELDLQPADGMMQRAFQLVKWLAEENPQGRWHQFLSSDGHNLRWDKVIISGSSHGATTAARFAKYQYVDRVVMLCGPRDQDQDWQANSSATPANRFFAFSHVLDSGWTGDHYCRSWELLGMHQYGPIVNVDGLTAPFGNSRRFISAADVDQDANRAHSSVTPGRSTPQNANGQFLFEPVWKYLYNHPVDVSGPPTAEDAGCQRVHIRN